MFELILYSAFWFVVVAVSAIVLVDALRIRDKIHQRAAINRQRGQV